jgi:hypothetical protein
MMVEGELPGHKIPGSKVKALVITACGVVAGMEKVF